MLLAPSFLGMLLSSVLSPLYSLILVQTSTQVWRKVLPNEPYDLRQWKINGRKTLLFDVNLDRAEEDLRDWFRAVVATAHHNNREHPEIIDFPTDDLNFGVDSVYPQTFDNPHRIADIVCFFLSYAVAAKKSRNKIEYDAYARLAKRFIVAAQLCALWRATQHGHIIVENSDPPEHGNGNDDIESESESEHGDSVSGPAETIITRRASKAKGTPSQATASVNASTAGAPATAIKRKAKTSKAPTGKGKAPNTPDAPAPTPSKTSKKAEMQARSKAAKEAKKVQAAAEAAARLEMAQADRAHDAAVLEQIKTLQSTLRATSTPPNASSTSSSARPVPVSEPRRSTRHAHKDVPTVNLSTPTTTRKRAATEGASSSLLTSKRRKH